MEAEEKKDQPGMDGQKKGGGILSQINELKKNQEREFAEMKEK